MPIALMTKMDWFCFLCFLLFTDGSSLVVFFFVIREVEKETRNLLLIVVQAVVDSDSM